jgi:toxin secretion/phage lysis holin
VVQVAQAAPIPYRGFVRPFFCFAGQQGSGGMWVLNIIETAGAWLRGSPLLETLLAFMALDILTGVMLAIVRRELNSSVSAIGACRKVASLAVVGVCVLLQKHMPQEAPIGAFGAIFFIASEGLSILENAALLGVPLPPWLADHLEKLKRDPSSRRARNGIPLNPE